MVGKIILVALLVLIILVLLLRVGVYISFGEQLLVRAKAGPVTVQILPKPAKKPKKKKQKKKKEKPEKKKEEKTAQAGEKKRPSITFEDIRTVVPALFESLKKGLRKTRRRLKIDPMRLNLVFGGEDPSKVAEMYGWTSTAVWTFMPQIERLTRMPDPRIHLDADYGSSKTKAEGELGISLQIRDIFAIGGAFAGPLLKWLIGFLKRRKARGAAEKKATIREKDTSRDTTETTHQDKGE